ncbi:hypothetical protein NE857_05545 [Nocardiopsis exhalans]|uniref:Uncharacterized protein n=1 Tax=Nocardiopsis exhalans TaxID=163604 RepID=A0ABY5DAQ3_9ACTN|nr:hypothetical protein [Nocardiopsis exhalans]USY21097.1 hypothetical protein NE857_05505 [Nocardiopsis exhalans]USY21105.1 hypothetical protein NE857_05545 [Nocardiopsis exhalans]
MTENTAVEAVQAEATASEAPKKLTLHGSEYLLPASSDQWPLAALEGFEEGKIVAALRSLLGPEQWARLKEAGATLSDLNTLAEQVATAYGFESAGE